VNSSPTPFVGSRDSSVDALRVLFILICFDSKLTQRGIVLQGNRVAGFISGFNVVLQ
jgi:hypothetical protein